MMVRKSVRYEKERRVYAIYYKVNNTLYYNTAFDCNMPKVIVIVMRSRRS